MTLLTSHGVLSRRTRALDVNRTVLIGSAILLVALAAIVSTMQGGRWQLAALTGVGALIGLVLFRASFGFSAAFRSLIEERNPYGLKAHAVMLALTTLFFLPLLAMGQVFGTPLNGGATPIGIAFGVGAVLFGIGMQIGGGCASGTLFALGGGNAKLAGTLAGFVIGSAIGAAHMGFWWSLPSLPAVVIQNQFGLWPALLGQLAVLGVLWLVANRYGRAPAEAGADLPLFQRLLKGPWPLLWGSVALAGLNILTLVLSGKPWGETSAFALWGSKLGDALGLTNAAGWTYWQRPGFTKQLEASVFTDITSVMDFAILFGAAIAAASVGAFKPRIGGTWKAWGGALLGGIVMGYGARLSNGCNIGAYFSSISAGNLAGWAWMALAIAGSAIGIKLRPLFDLAQANRDDGPVC